ncbi:tetratricopeptide repeat protein [Sphingomonas sp. Leaf21]|uniref:tetratricopeptide repeat protein n=1 Tax=Sphingomonas sp. Leaf21 TaxID=2876550 RepID=UPI001E47A63F|nr:tetratricopeptide repeat protein [Sphingomonas sp. Leaf21]
MAEDPIIPICKRPSWIGGSALALIAAPIFGLTGAPAVAAERPGPQPLAAYLSARVAAAEGRSATAAGDYAVALTGWPDDPAVAVRAYREAMISGDTALALRAARVMEAEKVAPIDVALLDLAMAARKNDRAAYDAALLRIDGDALRILSPVLRAWGAWDRRQPVEPGLDSAGKEPVARRLADENGILLAIASRKMADQSARVLLETMRAPADTRIAAAELMAGQGDEANARGLLSDPLVASDRKRLGRKPDLGFGVSRLLARVGAELVGEGPRPLVIALARTALIADPGNDRARLLMAEALVKDEAWDAAIAALAGVDPQRAFAHRAAVVRIGLLAEAGRSGEALMLANGLATAKTAGLEDWQVYADQLIAAKRPADAAPWYERVTRADPPLPWAAWLQYGGALDQAGRRDEADAALARAVALGPDEPLALNYLGYSRIERGQDVPGSLALLERASKLAPDDASITDSLGWGYFKAGQIKRALPLVEQAAIAEPANSEIADHLGDIYWTLGRRFEARYAWRAAALTADEAEQAALAVKLAR